MTDADAQIPDGYLVQELDKASYIKPETLKAWLRERRGSFGNKYHVKTDQTTDQHIVTVKRKIKPSEIEEIKKRSYPEFYTATDEELFS